jgi:dimethylglycine dehydrogenase
MRQIGNKALESLRIEKGYGIWSTEFTQEYTPFMCGLERFIDFDKGDFIGRDAVLYEREHLPGRKLVQLAVDTTDADARMLDPVYVEDKWVGFVTSGAFAHHSGLSLALAYIDVDAAQRHASGSQLFVDVIGERHSATILKEAPYDPKGKRLRI